MLITNCGAIRGKNGGKGLRRVGIKEEKAKYQGTLRKKGMGPKTRGLVKT